MSDDEPEISKPCLRERVAQWILLSSRKLALPRRKSDSKTGRRRSLARHSSEVDGEVFPEDSKTGEAERVQSRASKHHNSAPEQRVRRGTKNDRAVSYSRSGGRRHRRQATTEPLPHVPHIPPGQTEEIRRGNESSQLSNRFPEKNTSSAQVEPQIYVERRGRTNEDVREARMPEQEQKRLRRRHTNIDDEIFQEPPVARRKPHAPEKFKPSKLDHYQILDYGNEAERRQAERRRRQEQRETEVTRVANEHLAERPKKVQNPKTEQDEALEKAILKREQKRKLEHRAQRAYERNEKAEKIEREEAVRRDTAVSAIAQRERKEKEQCEKQERKWKADEERERQLQTAAAAPASSSMQVPQSRRANEESRRKQEQRHVNQFEEQIQQARWDKERKHKQEQDSRDKETRIERQEQFRREMDADFVDAVPVSTMGRGLGVQDRTFIQGMLPKWEVDKWEKENSEAAARNG